MRKSVFGAVSKERAEMNEKAYQFNHRKRKDRYASSKFYMNNFKRRKQRK